MELEKPYSLNKLSQYVDDDDDEIKEMITLFIDSIPLDINQLPELAKKRDWQSIYKIAHKVKPSFNVFAMNDILLNIKNIELKARNNNIDGDLKSCIDVLMKKFEEIVVLLKAECDNDKKQ